MKRITVITLPKGATYSDAKLAEKLWVEKFGHSPFIVAEGVRVQQFDTPARRAVKKKNRNV
jgi:hypothetical protein